MKHLPQTRIFSLKCVFSILVLFFSLMYHDLIEWDFNVIFIKDEFDFPVELTSNTILIQLFTLRVNA